MRVRWILVLVLAAMLAGGLLAEVLREPPGDASPEGERPRIEALEAEVARLRRERAVSATHDDVPERSTTPRSDESGTPRLGGGAPRKPADGVGLRPSRGNLSPARPVAAPRLSSDAAILDLVRHLNERDLRLSDTSLVQDGAAFALRFARRTDGPVVRGNETKPDADIDDGTTIVLDEGSYDFSAFSNAHRGRFPVDVTFRGIGMDRTLLIVHEIGATGETRNLAFEDLTLDTRGHYLADVRGDEPISLRFVRSRVIGFDQRPGGAVLLAARHGALFASEARFEAGFGNAPGAGSLFHVRGPFLVRFEHCAFVGAFESLYEKSERAAYAFVRCRFEKMAPERRRDLESHDANVLFEECLFEYEAAGEEAGRARSRRELNPEWP